MKIAIIIAIPKILREKLTDEGAEALIQVINAANEKLKEDIIALSSEKFETRVTKVESGLENKLTEVKTDLESKIAQVKSDLESKIIQVKSDLEVKIAQTRSDIIKWVFICVFGQYLLTVITVVSILFAFFKR